MNRFRIGVILLAVVLALSLAAQEELYRLHDPTAQAMETAAAAAIAGDWKKAQISAADGAAQWHHHRRLTAALADHQPMEDIESLLARLPIHAQQESTEEFAAACAELALRIRAVADAHRLRWSNLF